MVVLMLTVSENAADLGAALRAGARGYLLKNIEAEQLGQAGIGVDAAQKHGLRQKRDARAHQPGQRGGLSPSWPGPCRRPLG